MIALTNTSSTNRVKFVFKMSTTFFFIFFYVEILLKLNHHSGFSFSFYFSIVTVESLQSSIPAPPVNFQLRDDHLSGSSLKGNLLLKCINCLLT